MIISAWSLACPSRRTQKLSKVMDEAATDGSFTIAQTNGQERRDTRQNCRHAKGADGADKRNCKQTGRQN